MRAIKSTDLWLMIDHISCRASCQPTSASSTRVRPRPSTIHPGGPFHGLVDSWTRWKAVATPGQELSQEQQALALEVSRDRPRRIGPPEVPQDQEMPRHRNKEREGADEPVEGRELALFEGAARLEGLEVILHEPAGARVIDHGRGRPRRSARRRT